MLRLAPYWPQRLGMLELGMTCRGHTAPSRIVSSFLNAAARRTACGLRDDFLPLALSGSGVMRSLV